MLATQKLEERIPPPEHKRQPEPTNSIPESLAAVAPVPSEPEVIDGEITCIEPPPERCSSDDGQQGSPSEITVEVSPEPEPPPLPKQRRPYYLLVIVTTALGLTALLVRLLFPLLTPTAIVTIIPVGRALAITKTLSLQGRMLGQLTVTQSSSVPATGHRHQNAEVARGTVAFFNGLLMAQTIAAGTVLIDSDGVRVVTDAAASIPAGNPPVCGEVVVPAHALLKGPQGNIQAGNIHIACCAASVVAENLVAFTGGQNARDYTVATRQDIAAASSALQTSLKKAAQAGPAMQARSDEAVLTLPCHGTTQTNREPGDEAIIVQVTVTTACSGLAYAKGAVEDSAQRALTQEAVQQLGLGYGMLGSIQVSIIRAAFTDYAHGMATVQVKAEAPYAYHVTAGEEASMKHLIAGMSRQQAITSLSRLPGIQSATASEATLPTDPNCIQVVIVYP